jgi:hypothetical protein
MLIYYQEGLKRWPFNLCIYPRDRVMREAASLWIGKSRPVTVRGPGGHEVKSVRPHGRDVERLFRRQLRTDSVIQKPDRHRRVERAGCVPAGVHRYDSGIYGSGQDKRANERLIGPSENERGQVVSRRPADSSLGVQR